MFYTKKYAWALLLAPLFLLLSCKDDNVTPITTSGYENGVLIVNEGPFNTGTGTVLHYDRNTKTISTDIFASANGGAKAGNILQSVKTYNGNTYLMVNNANRVYVVDAKTFAFKDSIKGMDLPRFFEAVNSKKAYISGWANGISVIDLTTNKVTKTIKAGIGADRMLLNGSTMWVLNSGGFDSDSTITLIDVATDAVAKTLKAAPAPNSIVSGNGSIWVLCGNYFGKGKGKLLEYRNNAIVNTFDAPNGATNLVISRDAATLYFVANNIVYSKETSKPKVNPDAYILGATLKSKFTGLYSLGLDNQTGNLFCGDAKNYSANGKIYVFNAATRVLQDSISAGIIPTFFSFGN
jgi:DNA-binding beta-propeller fold protein YncE